MPAAAPRISALSDRVRYDGIKKTKRQNQQYCQGVRTARKVDISSCSIAAACYIHVLGLYNDMIGVRLRVRRITIKYDLP